MTNPVVEYVLEQIRIFLATDEYENIVTDECLQRVEIFLNHHQKQDYDCGSNSICSNTSLFATVYWDDNYDGSFIRKRLLLICNDWKTICEHLPILRKQQQNPLAVCFVKSIPSSSSLLSSQLFVLNSVESFKSSVISMVIPINRQEFLHPLGSLLPILQEEVTSSAQNIYNGTNISANSRRGGQRETNLSIIQSLEDEIKYWECRRDTCNNDTHQNINHHSIRNDPVANAVNINERVTTIIDCLLVIVEDIRIYRPPIDCDMVQHSWRLQSRDEGSPDNSLWTIIERIRASFGEGGIIENSLRQVYGTNSGLNEPFYSVEVREEIRKKRGSRLL